MAYKDDWSERWGWGYGGGESERGAVGGETGGAGCGLTNPAVVASSRVPHSPHLSRGELAAENRRLYLDNMRLWDCLALFRTDPSLTCQGAINTIFTLNDNEYLRQFPDTQQLLNTRFPGGLGSHRDELDALTENNRLREENTRLHAAVWVLRDNPSLQADSTVAAVFRLSDAQFQRKFGVVNQVNSGLCFRSHFERSSRNNNKTKVKAMRTHLDLGVNTNTIQLIKKPLGPRRLSRAKSMSSNRHASPLGESPVTLAIMAARQRSESAEPPQNFSSNRKPTTAEEMRDFLYGHKCDSSGSLFGTEVSASNLQDDEGIKIQRHIESTQKAKSKVPKIIMNSISDTNQPCSSNSMADSVERFSAKLAAKPIKCVSFEEPLPTSRQEAPAAPTDTDTDSHVRNIASGNTSQQRLVFKDRLRAILDTPVDSRPRSVKSHGEDRFYMKSELKEAVHEKGLMTTRSPRRRSASMPYSTTSADQGSCEQGQRRGGSEKGGMCNGKNHVQSHGSQGNLGISNSNRMGSRCPADEETDEEEEEEGKWEREDEYGSHRGSFYSLSGRSRRPGGLRMPYIRREPSKRHKQGIRLSPVLDPRASLQRLHVSAGDGDLLEKDSPLKDRTGRTPLDRNFNKNPDEILEGAEREAITPGRIIFSEDATANVARNKFYSFQITKTTTSNIQRILSDEDACFNKKFQVREPPDVNRCIPENRYGTRSDDSNDNTNRGSGSQMFTHGNRNCNASTKRALKGDGTTHIENKARESCHNNKDIRHADYKDKVKPPYTKLDTKHSNFMRLGAPELYSKTVGPREGTLISQPQPKRGSSVTFKDNTVKLESTQLKVEIREKVNTHSNKTNVIWGKKKGSDQGSIKSDSIKDEGINSAAVANNSDTQILMRCKSGRVAHLQPNTNGSKGNDIPKHFKGVKPSCVRLNPKQSALQTLNCNANKIIDKLGEVYQKGSGKYEANAYSQNNQISTSEVKIQRNSPGIRGTEHQEFVTRDKVNLQEALRTRLGKVFYNKNTNKLNILSEMVSDTDGNGQGRVHGPQHKIQLLRIKTPHGMDSENASPTSEDGVFRDSKHRSFRKGPARRAYQTSFGGGMADVIHHITPTNPRVVPLEQPDRRKLLRPKSAVARQINTTRQANLKRSAETLVKMTTSNAPVRYSHTMRTSQSRRRSKPRIVTTGHEPDDKDNDGFKRVVGLASSGHVTCPGSLSTKTPSIFYSNWHEEFRSQPEVYLSKQPAPARASRYKPYPHRSYVSVKHFTDRHQRLMPQIAQPSARQGTSAIFSFTREKSPSMAVVLDDDFQRWMHGRVRADSVPHQEAVSTHEFFHSRSSIAHRSDRRKSACKHGMEHWPRVKPLEKSIFDTLDISCGDGSAEPIKGALKNCNNVPACGQKEARLRMLKDLRAVRYKKALAAMIRQNTACARQKLGEAKPGDGSP